MNKRIIIVFSSILTLILGVAAVYIGINLNKLPNTTPNDSSAAPAYCRKSGVNFAVNVGTFDVVGANQRANRLGMGYSLVTALSGDEGQFIATRDALQAALDNNITPVLRICVGSSCAFSNPQTYIDFLNRLATDSKINGRTFYAIAGSNEPLSEPWTGGSVGNPTSVGPPLKNYMNAVISGVGNVPNIKLLSPAFNSTNPLEESLIDNMSGANWNGLDAIAVNAYNNAGYQINGVDYGTTTKQLQRIKNKIPGRQYLITETGLFESERNATPDKNTPDLPHQTALNNFKNEVQTLYNDSSTIGFLVFNGFANNPDGNFQYNNLTDSEYAYVLGSECIGGTGVTPTTGGGGGSGQCPASVSTVFIVDNSVSGSNTTTRKRAPVNKVQIAASTNGGLAFNNFSGQLVVSGSQNNTYAGNVTTDLIGPFVVGNTYKVEAKVGNNICATSNLRITGATTTPITSPTPGTCPSNLFTVFIVDDQLTAANTTTNKKIPVNKIQIAASSNGGGGFNNFDGDLILSGSQTGTFSGNDTTDLEGPFEGGESYTLTAQSGTTVCQTSVLNITSDGTTPTPSSIVTVSPTSIVTSTTSPIPTVFTTNSPIPTTNTGGNNGGGITPTTIQVVPTISTKPLPETAIDDSKLLKIILGFSLLGIGSMVYLAVNNYKK